MTAWSRLAVKSVEIRNGNRMMRDHPASRRARPAGCISATLIPRSCAHDFARDAGRRASCCGSRISIPGRSREEHVAGILEDLAWLGLDWDGPGRSSSPGALPLYAAALARLRRRGWSIPASAPAPQIAAESRRAPPRRMAPDGPLYPGTCRAPDPRRSASGGWPSEPHAWRLDVARAAARGRPAALARRAAGRVAADPDAMATSCWRARTRRPPIISR